LIGKSLAIVGNEFTDFCLRLGGVAILSLTALKELMLPPYRLWPIIREMHEIGGKSLGVVAVLGLFTAMALALQTGITLSRFQGKMYVGPLVALAMFRELGPVLSGFMVAARAGSGIAAEIGAMKVSEQIDAMRACGASPVRDLVCPKMVASALVMPLLTAAGNAAGVLGGLLVATTMLDMDPYYYINSIRNTVLVSDYMSGLGKTVVFGMLITAVSCYEGLHATHGSLGVSRAANRSVVLTFMLILLSDVLIIGLLLALGDT
jgi:phospholipid/cholesterol/gamma-HCH transport system permease protein